MVYVLNQTAAADSPRPAVGNSLGVPFQFNATGTLL